MGAIDRLLADLERVPRLTRAEEVALARRVEAGDRAARDRMVEANLRLVVSVARTHTGRGLPLEDLVQEGAIGLMRAVELWDHRRGLAFSTYATWWIRQGMQAGLVRQARAVRLPQHVERRMRSMRAAEGRLTRELERLPAPAEVARAAGMSREEVESLARWDTAPVSLDGPGGAAAIARAAGADGPEEAALARERAEVLAGELRRLPQRPREVVRARYGLGGRPARTLAQVGAVTGVSRERVRCIEREALDRLALRAPVRALRDAA